MDLLVLQRGVRVAQLVLCAQVRRAARSRLRLRAQRRRWGAGAFFQQVVFGARGIPGLIFGGFRNDFSRGVKTIAGVAVHETGVASQAFALGRTCIVVERCTEARSMFRWIQKCATFQAKALFIRLHEVIIFGAIFIKAFAEGDGGVAGGIAQRARREGERQEEREEDVAHHGGRRGGWAGKYSLHVAASPSVSTVLNS